MAAFTSTVSSKPTLNGSFQFDPNATNNNWVTNYNCGCCSGNCTISSQSYSNSVLTFSFSCGSPTSTAYTFSGTYTVPAQGPAYFANGTCAFPGLPGTEEDWTATAKQPGEDKSARGSKPSKKAKASKKAKSAKKVTPAKKAKPTKKANAAKKSTPAKKATKSAKKAAKATKSAKKAAKATKSAKGAKSAKKR